MAFPLGDGGTMHRVQAGDVTLKLSQHNTVPAAKNPPGGATTAVGIRYFTFWVRNLVEVVDKCTAGGYSLAVPVTTVRAGTQIAIVEDPDGNWVEFLQMD
jgi:glyoxylase I family protein